jgi:hypothetical protein
LRKHFNSSTRYESGTRNEPTRRSKITEIFIETQQEVCGAFEIP